MMWSINTYDADNEMNSKIVQFNVWEGRVINILVVNLGNGIIIDEIDGSSDSHFLYVEYLVSDLLLFSRYWVYCSD